MNIEQKLIDLEFENQQLELRNQALRHVLLVFQNSMTHSQREQLKQLHQQTDDRLLNDIDLTEQQEEILESLLFALENVLNLPRDQTT